MFSSPSHGTGERDNWIGWMEWSPGSTVPLASRRDKPGFDRFVQISRPAPVGYRSLLKKRRND